MSNRNQKVTSIFGFGVKRDPNKTNLFQYQSTILNMTNTHSPKAAGVQHTCHFAGSDYFKITEEKEQPVSFYKRSQLLQLFAQDFSTLLLQL